MPQLPDEVLYDKRLIERHIRRGVLSREDVNKRLSQLEDSAEEADVIDIDQLQLPRGAAVGASVVAGS